MAKWVELGEVSGAGRGGAGRGGAGRGGGGGRRREGGGGVEGWVGVFLWIMYVHVLVCALCVVRVRV